MQSCFTNRKWRPIHSNLLGKSEETDKARWKLQNWHWGTVMALTALLLVNGIKSHYMHMNSKQNWSQEFITLIKSHFCTSGYKLSLLLDTGCSSLQGQQTQSWKQPWFLVGAEREEREENPWPHGFHLCCWRHQWSHWLQWIWTHRYIKK